MMRINKRWLLIALVSGAQAVCLLAALTWFTAWLQGGLRDLMRQQVLSDNRQVAEQMASLIRQMGLSDLTPGTRDWERLQEAVEHIRLPNQGFLCVIRNEDGRMLCHPELRHDPMVAGMKPGQALLEGPQAGKRIIETGESAAGWAQMPDGTHLIGVRDLPKLGVKVMAHQREAGILTAIEAVVRPVRHVGLAVAATLFVLSGLLTSAIVRRYENKLAAINANLERLVERRSRALMKTRDAVIFGLARLAESRDDDTGQHLDRIRSYVHLLAQALAANGAKLDEESIHLITETSSLHDIGKVGTPDAVLLKPGKLSTDERHVIQKHPLIGGDCLLAIKQRLGEDDFLTTACEIAFSHHERWDGNGYPFGLAGDQIPLAGRIVALADVYDALTSKRVYKEAMSHSEARRIILEGRGTHFDPQVVQAFLSAEAAFAAASRGASGKVLGRVA